MNRNYDSLLAFLLALSIVALTTLKLSQNFNQSDHRQQLTNDIAGGDDANKIALKCQNLPIVVHRPYQCALELRDHDKKFETWMNTHGHKYEILGIFHLQRHCSRFSTGNHKTTKALLKLISPKSFLSKTIKQVLSEENYPYGELTPGGISESFEMGRAFRQKFSEKFFGAIQYLKDIKINCSSIKRTQDTANYFVKGAFPEFSLSKHEIPITPVDYLRQNEGKTASEIESVTAYENWLTHEANKRLQKHKHLVHGKNLKLKDLKALINILSLNDAQFGTQTFLKTFGQKLSKSNNYYRELERYYKSSIGGCSHCNETSRNALKMIIRDLEWLAEIRSNNQSGRISLSFSHDNNIIALMDYIGFFEGEQDIANRNVPMCSNFEIIVMKEQNSGKVHALLLFNEEVKEFYLDEALGEPANDSTYSMDSLLHYLRDRLH